MKTSQNLEMDQNLEDIADEDNSKNTMNMMSRGTAMTVLGLWRTKQPDRDSYQMILTKTEVLRAFRREISNAVGGYDDRGYSLIDFYEACQILMMKMKNNKLKLRMNQERNSQSKMSVFFQLLQQQE